MLTGKLLSLALLLLQLLLPTQNLMMQCIAAQQSLLNLALTAQITFTLLTRTTSHATTGINHITIKCHDTQTVMGSLGS